MLWCAPDAIHICSGIDQRETVFELCRLPKGTHRLSSYCIFMVFHTQWTGLTVFWCSRSLAWRMQFCDEFAPRNQKPLLLYFYRLVLLVVFNTQSAWLNCVSLDGNNFVIDLHQYQLCYPRLSVSNAIGNWTLFQLGDLREIRKGSLKDLNPI